MLKRLIIGILKGLILGGGMAVALYMLAHIGSVSGFWGYLLYLSLIHISEPTRPY